MEQKRTPNRSATNGTRNRLKLKNTDPAYEYRIVNDIDDRVQCLLDVGYEIDTNTKVGDKRAGMPSSAPGSLSTVSLGQGDKGIVMRIKKELKAERNAEKAEVVRRRDVALQNPAQNGADYGKVTLSRS